MTRLSEILGKKYAIDVMLHLLEGDTPPTKLDILKALGYHRIISLRINELESEGLIEVSRNNGKHNCHYVRLTWYGKKIALALKECDYLFEKITS